ncbi:MAG: SDR family oxidoreductase [Proteobacteria bacterium]|nr:SDR family oxidoreductase [Pseudomonadota bacterium]
MSDAQRLLGSRAIVTGASNGVGEAIVRTFVKQGAMVFAVDGPDSGIETNFKALQNVIPYAETIADEQSAAEMVKRASEALAGLDIVVNNSSLQASMPISDGDEAELEQFLKRKIQLYAATTRVALPYLEKSPAGRIINTGCLRSAFSRTGNAAYARSEAAIAELTQSLAAEAGPNGTTVNYVQPGAIMTPASRRIFAEDKALRDYCIAQSAAKRLGDPVDIAKVVLFLASDDAVFVSGTGIVVDGGST